MQPLGAVGHLNLDVHGICRLFWSPLHSGSGCEISGVYSSHLVGIEDTRMALRAARAEGVNPFCVTIDNEAREYLPHLFGAGRYALIQRPAELPARLPQWYARLTHV